MQRCIHGTWCHVFSKLSFPVGFLWLADTEGLWLVSPEPRNRHHQNASSSISCTGKKTKAAHKCISVFQFLCTWIQNNPSDHLALLCSFCMKWTWSLSPGPWCEELSRNSEEAVLGSASINSGGSLSLSCHL